MTQFRYGVELHNLKGTGLTLGLRENHTHKLNHAGKKTQKNTELTGLTRC